MALKILVIINLVLWWGVASLPSRELRLVFCQVGQGDAILISKGFTQILIDGGPDARVLGCLAKNMPFFDKRLDAVILTHPESDHMNGLIAVAERYQIGRWFTAPIETDTPGLVKFKEWASEGRFGVGNLFAGDKLEFAGVEIEVVWPVAGWARFNSDQKKSYKIDQADLGWESMNVDTNMFGIVTRVEYGQFSAVLGADVESVLQPQFEYTGGFEKTTVFKVPHHGSKAGVSEEWLERLSPKLAVIQVAKNNYGHPAEEVIQLFEKYKIPIWRTDIKGDLKISSNGKRWRID